jgi:ATP-binding cassette subfamily B protein
MHDLSSVPQTASLRALLRASLNVLKLTARANKRIVVTVLIFAALSGVIPTVSNALRGVLINHIVSSARIGTWEPIITIILALVILITYLDAGIDQLDSYLRNVLWFNLREAFTFEIIRAKSELSLAQHEDPGMANFLQRVSEEGANRAQEFSNGSITIVTSLVGIVASAIALASVYWWMLPLLLVGTLPELWMHSKRGRDQWQLTHRNTEGWRLFYAIRNYFWGAVSIIEVKLLDAVDYFTTRARELFHGLSRDSLTLQRHHLRGHLLAELVTQSTAGFALAFFVWHAVHGQLQVGTLTFLFASIFTFRSALSTLFLRIGRQYEHSLFVLEMFEFFKMQTTLPPPTHPVVLQPHTPLHIQFENVSFTYPGRDLPALRNVSLELRAGEKIALIGLNGAGKSTFVKLLCRLYDPSEGRIVVNGIDLREVDLPSYYALLGVLFQDFNRYVMTVREAVAVGDVHLPIDDARVRTAAEQSESSAFIAELNDGYNQLLSKDFKKGTNLSGGQWQKLALARLFYRQPRLYVLDEPTAAIDAVSEAEIFNRLDKLPRDQSVLFISHRFSTVRSADTIVVMENGTITEAGTHTELMRRAGTYKRLFKLQADRYLKRLPPVAAAEKTMKAPRKKKVSRAS